MRLLQILAGPRALPLPRGGGEGEDFFGQPPRVAAAIRSLTRGYYPRPLQGRQCAALRAEKQKDVKKARNSPFFRLGPLKTA